MYLLPLVFPCNTNYYYYHVLPWSKHALDQLSNHPIPCEYVEFPMRKALTCKKDFGITVKSCWSQTTGLEDGKSVFREPLKLLERRWTKCISLNRDYVEQKILFSKVSYYKWFRSGSQGSTLVYLTFAIVPNNLAVVYYK